MMMTLPAVKAYLGITTTDDDAFLTQQITLVSDAIQSYCRRRFDQSDWIQTFYRKDYDQARIPFDFIAFHFPLIGVGKITIDGVEYTSTDLTENFRVHKPTGKIISNIGLANWQTISMEYTSGYTTLPATLQNILCSIVQERYNKKNAGVS